MEEPTRRYQLRARSKAPDDAKVAQTAVKAAGTKTMTRSATAGGICSAAITTAKTKHPAANSTVQAPAAPVRPARRPAQAKKSNAENPQPSKKTGIPVPIRATRSGRTVSMTQAGASTTAKKKNPDAPATRASGRRAAEKAPATGLGAEATGSSDGAAAKGKKVTFQDDKENLLPASEKEAELKEQEMTAEQQRPANPLLAQPVRKVIGSSAASSSSSPVKSAIRPIPALYPSQDDSIPIGAPLNAAPRRSATGGIGGKNLFLDEGPDELGCPLSPNVMASPARRPKATRLPPPMRPELGTNVLASPPRRPVKVDRPLPSVALTYDPPHPAPLQSPAKRNISLQNPARVVPPLNLLASPPKRPSGRRPIFEPTSGEEDTSMDELSLETYSISKPGGSIQKPVTRAALQPLKVTPALDPNPSNETEAQEDGANKKVGDLDGVGDDDGVKDLAQRTPLPLEKDADGDIEMADAGMEEGLVESPISPCPANFPPQPRGYGLFSSPETEGENEQSGKSVVRGVTPLVSDLEGLGLETSRRSLFPTQTGNGSVALENSLQLGSSKTYGEIPIDPMLLEDSENQTAMGTSTTVPVNFGDEDDEEIPSSSTCVRAPLSSTSSGSRKGRRSSIVVPNGILAGAVVFVDVYTAEGADASSTFIDMLHNLGAKTVKRWDWNPSKQDGKIGITHVVFKDGSARTLQRVRQSNGVVVCVGAGWIVECEKEQRWVDESLFHVDLDFIPRGGHRRRKSMEPKQALPPRSTSKSSRTPVRQFQVAVDEQHHDQPSPPPAPAPPPCSDDEDEDNGDDDVENNVAMVVDEDYRPAPLSSHRPITPPQQEPGINRLGFYTNNPHNTGLMDKLILARRKSLQFAPKVGSPLARNCMWAD